jgi:DNA-binding HxlR family transcriptional regulator
LQCYYLKETNYYYETIGAENMNNKQIKPRTVECYVEKTLNIIGGKWSFLIIKHLFNGTKRFGELRHALHDISPKTLTAYLRSLEEQNILTREVIPTIPPAVNYTLTEKGMDLQNIVNEMKLWGERWADNKS